MCTLCNQIGIWNRLYRCKDSHDCAEMENIVGNLLTTSARTCVDEIYDSRGSKEESSTQLRGNPAIVDVGQGTSK